MIKKIFALFISILLPFAAQADDQRPVPGAFTRWLASSAGAAASQLRNNTYHAGTLIDGSAQNILGINSSDVTRVVGSTGVSIAFGAGGGSNATNFTATSMLAGAATATTYVIGTNSVDAADSNTVLICGGGTGSAGRGACAMLQGNEVSGGGDIIFDAGDSVGSGIIFRLNRAGTSMDYRTSSNTVMWSFDEATGKLYNGATAGGDLRLEKTGTTVGIDSGTAASACAGTGTHNGTTAVTISTTCATTGNRIFFDDTSEPTASSGCWVTNVVNGTSFDVDCKSASQDATFVWWIQREA